MCSNGLERHFFLAPDGSSYSGRKQAVEYMKKTEASQEDIRKMESGFKVSRVRLGLNYLCQFFSSGKKKSTLLRFHSWFCWYSTCTVGSVPVQVVPGRYLGR